MQVDEKRILVDPVFRGKQDQHIDEFGAEYKEKRH
ncbi:hypothetical protein PQ465_11700 [Sphingobacterium oryzagri]|uniref:Uncharacterized protein n=1 Tax=Sphingobacterium oryzagri TaxID=3025669 RepID=A0ABY7WNT7_9SPHI|nr:hypothetical protein [Sphingobacterium sp. KACC 22765]WDF70853.1 hypothetical protein PQ465_11700 [Sphingobacterium sp. KACC 22765]